MKHCYYAHWLGFILLLLSLGACNSYTPPVGTLLVDTDLPAMHSGTLPIGITLDPGEEGKDLLSPNLLVNGTFDLAPRLRDCVFNLQQQTITTPNQFTTYYPLPEYLYGWERLSGNISLTQGVSSTSDPTVSHQLFFHLTQRDSLAQLLHTGFPLSIGAGEQLTFSCQAKIIGNAKLTISLVNDSLQLVSDEVPLVAHSPEWSTLQGTITATSHTRHASLLLTATYEVKEGAKQYYQDDEGNWRSLPSYIWLDNCSLRPSHLQLKDGISTELHALLQELEPTFVRFPSGRTANGFYPGTYPVHLDSLEQTPFWTLSGAEYTGDFTSHHLTTLAHSLHATPVLITNFGFTDPTAQQRIEGLKLLEERTDYLATLYNTIGSNDLVLQLGYDLTSPEYTLRFFQALQYMKRWESLPPLITGGALTPEKRYSDYPTDLVLPTIERPSLAGYLPAPDSTFYLTEPLYLGEVHFAQPDTAPLALSPLLQRVTFLIEAERYTGAIQGLTLMPLLAPPSSPQLPLIYYHATHYEPSLLFTYLLYFQQLRGQKVRRLSIIPSTTSLYCSLTSDAEGKNYFLKVANTTRHPLTYNIVFQGLYSKFTHYSTVRYTPALGEFIEEEKQKIPSLGLNYTFDPYEIVILHFIR